MISPILEGRDTIGNVSLLVLNRSQIDIVYLYVKDKTEESYIYEGALDSSGVLLPATLPSELSIQRNLNQIIQDVASGEELFFQSKKSGNFVLSSLYEFKDKQVVAFTFFNSPIIRNIILQGGNFTSEIYFKNKSILSSDGEERRVTVFDDKGCLVDQCEDSNLAERGQTREVIIDGEEYVYTFFRQDKYGFATFLRKSSVSIVGVLNRNMLLIIVGALICIIVAAHIISDVSSKRTSNIINLFKAFARKGENFDATIIDKMDSDMKSFVETTKGLIDDRVAKEHLEGELETTESVQRQFFPKLYFNNHFVKFEGTIINPSQCSGDGIFYREFKGQFIVVLNDIAGHGISSALSVASIPVALDGFLALKGSENFIPSDFISYFNKISFNIESIKTTLVVGVFDYKTREFKYSLGGHDGLFYKIGENGEIIDLVAEHGAGSRVGIIENESFENHSLVLEDNERVFVCTDGMISDESTKKGRKLNKRLIKELKNAENFSLTEKLKDMIYERFSDSELSEEDKDDATFFLIGPNPNIEGKRKVYYTNPEYPVESLKEGISYLKNDQRKVMASPDRAEEVNYLIDVFKEDYFGKKLSSFDPLMTEKQREKYVENIANLSGIGKASLEILKYIAGEFVSNAIFHTDHSGEYVIDIVKKGKDRWVIYKDNLGQLHRETLLRKIESALRGELTESKDKGVGLGMKFSIDYSDTFICHYKKGNYTHMAFRIPKRFNEDEKVIMVSDEKGEF